MPRVTRFNTNFTSWGADPQKRGANIIVMNKEVREVRNLAKHNKNNIMFKSLDIEIGNSQYSPIIKGVGAKAIKLELYIYYEDILNKHDKEVLEGILWEKINRVYPDTKSTTIGHKRVYY